MVGSRFVPPSPPPVHDRYSALAGLFAQAVHLAVDAGGGLYCPVGQSTHDLDPATGFSLPSGHATHRVFSVCVPSHTALGSCPDRQYAPDCVPVQAVHVFALLPAGQLM